MESRVELPLTDLIRGLIVRCAGGRLPVGYGILLTLPPDVDPIVTLGGGELTIDFGTGGPRLSRGPGELPLLAATLLRLLSPRLRSVHLSWSTVRVVVDGAPNLTLHVDWR